MSSLTLLPLFQYFLLFFCSFINTKPVALKKNKVQNSDQARVVKKKINILSDYCVCARECTYVFIIFLIRMNQCNAALKMKYVSARFVKTKCCQWTVFSRAQHNMKLKFENMFGLWKTKIWCRFPEHFMHPDIFGRTEICLNWFFFGYLCYLSQREWFEMQKKKKKHFTVNQFACTRK